MKEIIGTFKQFWELQESFGPACLFRGQVNALDGLLPGIGRRHPRYDPSPALEQAFFDQFKARAIPYLQGSRPENDWDWLIKAQHYGLKTRLLDWTTNPRVALYFASLAHDEMFRVPFSVFILRNFRVTRYEALPKFPMACNEVLYFQPPHIDARITNQEAYFSVHPDPFKCHVPEDCIQFSIYPYPLERQKISKFLSDSRVAPAYLTPGLEGICRSLVDDPRTTTHLDIPEPRPVRGQEWRPLPNSAYGKTPQMLITEIFETRRLEVDPYF